MPVDAWTVSGITAHLAAVIRADPALGDCLVRGELSNHKVYSSGHHYFTLKDAEAELRCVMFRREAATLRFEPADGMAVRAAGRIDIYEQRGQYQLYVRGMVHDGLGALYEAFERLRDKLEAEGLFDPARKQPLPRYPCRVAVITSPTGAAVRDMVRVLLQRWPAVHILLVDAVVQGDQAAASLVHALEQVNELGEVDVILFGRGGGSIEDLWAFNEEPVARAIAASRIPVISCVGHETDFTISDFVADLRAATPTHAAELAVPDRADVARHLGQLDGRLAWSLRRRVESARQRLELLASRRVLVQPRAALEPKLQLVDELGERAGRALRSRLERGRERLDGLAKTLAALDPTGVLGRGYAIVARARDGKVVTAPADLPSGEAAKVRVKAGELSVVAQ